MGSIRSGRANEDTKAIERNWPFPEKPRCDCGNPLGRLETGICGECLERGRTRPDA